MKTKLILLAAVLTLTACGKGLSIDPNPKVAYTDKGAVTCILYTENIKLWDKAVSRPANLSDDVAHAICKSVGFGFTEGTTLGTTWSL